MQPGVDRSIVSRPMVRRTWASMIADPQHRRAQTETDIDASTVFSPRREPVAVARTLSSSRSVQVLSRPVSVDFTVRCALDSSQLTLSGCSPRAQELVGAVGHRALCHLRRLRMCDSPTAHADGTSDPLSATPVAS